MIKDHTVMLNNVVLSLSDALDIVHPEINDHQQRVAYGTLRLAQALDFPLDTQADLMYAATLHDFGILSVEDKLSAIRSETVYGWPHTELGADLLRRFAIFEQAAEYVQRHHHPWNDEKIWEDDDEQTKLFSNMINLADNLDRWIKKDVYILEQREALENKVIKQKGTMFAPVLVDCFLELSYNESFWLDFVSSRIYSILTGMIAWPQLFLDFQNLEQLGEVFSRVVDFRSRFTSTHSIGVAVSAKELAGRMCFENDECHYMLIAGYLHDLGKIAIPNAILEKPGKLDKTETDIIKSHTYFTYLILDTIGGFENIKKWAAFHHERMDGKGYPFHLQDQDLPLGSRIMAVADVFTAIAEDRPYRAGMSREKCGKILQSMVDSKALDGRIVKALLDDFEPINKIRKEKQKEYEAEYDRYFVKYIRN